MDSTTASSTAIESCISSDASPPSKIVKLLEVSLISARELAPISKSMHTYAVAWIDPNRKRTTQTDQHGHKNPEWNDKFVFRLDNDRLEDAAVTVEIYAISWFSDVLVGSVRVLISELIAPLLQTEPNRTKRTHFVTLQVRRPSGGPQGTLNMGVALMDSTIRSMPLHNYIQQQQQQQKTEQHYDDDDDDDDHKKLNAKIHLWRSMSAGSDLINNDDFKSRHGSVVNGSTWENSSDLCSDIGPSVSMVAGEEPAMQLPPPPPPGKAAQADDTGSAILEVMTIEEAKARGYISASKERGRKAASDDDDDGDKSELPTGSRKHSRRRSDGGLFSCFAYGIEFTIVCGASKKPSSNRRSGSSRRKPSELNAA